VHSLALHDLRNFKAQRDPSLPRSGLMDRAVFTIDLDAGACVRACVRASERAPARARA
jgi:hypothetical protein